MQFATSITTAPTIEPVTLDEAKDYAKIETADDDKVVKDLITSSRLYVENYLRRALLTQTITMTIDWCFPCVIELPIGPVQSVTAANFTYVDNDGNSTQVPTATYTSDVTSDPARIYLAYNKSWPTNRIQRKAISVEFVAGYGDLATDVPEPIRTAIKMMITYHGEVRQPASGTIGGAIINFPRTVDDLLLPYTVLI